ncbi:N-6 DNA methylase [Candidatus Margulisiibacteriota bacterium]
MKSFIPYLAHLQELTSTVTSLPSINNRKIEITSALNGQPSEFLRSNVSLTKLRNSGAFFTGHKLAKRLVLPLKSFVPRGSKIFDPACGSGDLLLAYAKLLPVFDSLEKTLAHWGSILYGYDIHEEFVKTAKLRLVLLAKTRCQKSQAKTIDLENVFPNIVVKNFLSPETTIPQIDIVLLNPPYTRTTAYKCDWATGLITSAGIFVSKCIESCPAKTTIHAILPDVLRAGSLYKKWRELISSQAKVESLEIIGKFDAQTDVDVFFLRLYCSAQRLNRVNWNLTRRRKSTKRFGNVFSIKIGPVVPFRDKKIGPPRPYIDTKIATPWKIIHPGAIKRKYNKKLYKPPFVVVRRTSGPSDKFRAVASIVSGGRKVAVENHLIILQPRSKSIAICRRALKILKSEETSTWLNRRIRCRHLTTAAISEIPWIEPNKNDEVGK